MKNKPFENFDFTDFWDDDEYAMNEYIGAPPTEEMIEETERELGYKLPESYIWLMKQHNGGIPFNVCFPCDEPTSWAFTLTIAPISSRFNRSTIFVLPIFSIKLF